jgi:lipopolysaccharide biosynthesis protein
MCFGGQRVDMAIARELMRVVQLIAVQAGPVAERTHMATQREQQRILELEWQQARYEGPLAERRCAAFDPDNRLIAS